jgi:hypothetical protein
MDVYDMNGNCIFRQISNLLPREETLLTSPDTGATLRKVKSLWVIRQSVDHPFPEDPEFQLVQQTAQRHTRRELQLMAMNERPLWRCLSAEEIPPGQVLLPLAKRIGDSIGCQQETVLRRLADYRAFRMEQTPLVERLAHVTKDTALDQLGFSVRTYHCLARSRLQTVAELLALTDGDIARLYHSNDSILAEINLYRHTLTQLLQQAGTI